MQRGSTGDGDLTERSGARPIYGDGPAPSALTRPDESMSLLTDLFRTAAEDEYRDAAQRLATTDPDPPSQDPRPPSRWRTPRVRAAVLLTAGVAVLGLLLATTALQVRRGAPEAAAERASLVERIEAMRARSATLQTQLTAVETALSAAQEDALVTTEEGEAISTELDQLALISGATPVTGPGLVVIVDDAVVDPDEPPDPGSAPGDFRVQDIDLRQVLNGLWSAGAEAVSVDGTRVTSRTSIRAAGDALFADLVPLRPPYEVRAIGDPETLGPRFLDSAGASWLQVLAATYGITFDVSTESVVTLPAVATLDLTWAEGNPRTDS